jgi:hypothetical protein
MVRGGFSFFGPRYGFVVDNVVNFEVLHQNSDAKYIANEP